MRHGRADRFLAPKSEGERDLVSPGMIAAGCRRPDGLPGCRKCKGRKELVNTDLNLYVFIFYGLGGLCSLFWIEIGVVVLD